MLAEVLDCIFSGRRRRAAGRQVRKCEGSPAFMSALNPVSHPLPTSLAPERLLRLDMLRDDAGQILTV